MQVSRRQFFKICAGGMAGTTAAALGFAPSVALAETRQYKLLRTRETRNTCTYCSVGCGLLMYSLGDGAKNAKASIFHIEVDPDHPVNRGALCPKGAGLVDFIHSESRLKFPEYRAPGSDKWQQISWEEAFDRIAKLMKEDRDANYIAQNAEGVTVNRRLFHLCRAACRYSLQNCLPHRHVGGGRSTDPPLSHRRCGMERLCRAMRAAIFISERTRRAERTYRLCLRHVRTRGRGVLLRPRQCHRRHQDIPLRPYRSRLASMAAFLCLVVAHLE